MASENKNKLSVEQVVFLKPIGNEARHTKEIKRGIVTKVGKKYFYVQQEEYYPRGREIKLKLDTMTEDDGEYIPGWIVYTSEQELKDNMEFEKLDLKLRVFFSQAYKTGLTLDQLRRIDSIVEENE